jgi:hypothetical protein
MQRSSLMPFFWSRWFAPAFLAGALASGCAAGGGSLEGDGTEPFEQGSPPATNTPTLPNAAPPSAPPAQNQGTPPGNAAQTPTTPLTPAAPSEPAPENAAGSDGNSEVLPTPERDEPAVPPNPGGNGGGNPAGDDDDDGDNDDDDDGDNDDDNDDGDDNDDDDDRDDDDGDGDDGDDDDDDDAGVNPPPNPAPNPDPVTPPADVLTFTADIRPILVTNCGRCHASGGLPNFASANAATGFDVAFRERNEIIELIQDGEMPADTCNGAPGSNGCVSVADFDLIRQWVAAGAPE